MIGMDPVQGLPRFTFDQMELMDGLGFIPVVMGLFGVGEILLNAEQALRPILDAKMSSLIPTRKDVADSTWPVIRGTVLGFFLGLIPGVTNSATSFMSYAVEKKVSKHPERFGTGVIAGIAGPETANNAHANAALIPLFTLGIPASPSIAVLMGAFMMNGLIPGPFLFKEHPDFVWAVIASMYVGNVFLLILNLPLIGIWVRILQIPYSILFALILCFTTIGAFSINNSTFDIGLMTLFGVIGYALKKLDFPLAPAVLTLILGPLMEKSLRRSLDMSQGDFAVFLDRPICLALFAIAAVVLISPLLGFLSDRRKAVSGESS